MGLTYWGQTWEVPPTTFILHLTTTLHTRWLQVLLKLDLDWKKFEICKVLALGALPLIGPPIGATCTIWTDFESRVPLGMIPGQHVWLKSQTHAFSKKRSKQLLFYKGPTGAHWGYPGNCAWTTFHFLHLFKVMLHNYITWLKLTSVKDITGEVLDKFGKWQTKVLAHSGASPPGPPWGPLHN